MTEDFYFIHPKSGQRVLVGARSLPDPRPDVFPLKPKVGLVIGTYGGEAYVELALAVRSRSYPQIPVLVHDDASNQTARLQALCDRYGVDFETNSVRLGHQSGDLSSLIGGLLWAKKNGIDLLVKMSQRFIPLCNWTPSLIELAMASQFPGFSNVCHHHRMPIRTECIGMAVREWIAPDISEVITRFILNNVKAVAAEHYLDGYTQTLRTRLCPSARAWEARSTQVELMRGYAVWDFLTANRAERSAAYLWHHANGPEDYLGLSQHLGLDYGPNTFDGT
jgi:hypothetical protein